MWQFGQYPGTRLRRGVLRFLTGPFRPFKKIPGSDVSGVVTAVGGCISKFKEGDGVFALIGMLSGGAFAEYVLVPEKLAAKRPRNISCQDAAAIPLVAQAALQALRDLGNIRRSMSVLINGASGGVGTCAIQIAKFIGAKVTAVGPADSLDLMRSLGADRVIDYKSEDFTADKNAYDIIFDLVTSSFWKCRGSLKRGGVFIASNPSPSLVFAIAGTMLSRKKAKLLATSPSGKDLAFITVLIESGALRPAIDRKYPLAQAAEGHRYSELGYARGKIVITI
jgi:NADPH:quinone reductase-like Zn-dependent oxidoreductase